MGKTLRFTKEGRRVFDFTHSRGYDPNTGKRLSPFSMRWEVPEGYSDKKAYKEAEIREAKFHADCEAGKIKTKREQKAEALQQAMLTERAKLEYTNNPSLADYVEDQYIPERKRELKQGSIENNIRPSLQYLINKIGQMKLVDITSSIMRKIVTELFNDSGFAYSSCDNRFIVWKCMFDKAVEDHIINESPLKDVKKPKKPKTEIDENDSKSLSLDEFSRLEKAIEEEPLTWQALFYVMADTGCRRGEIAGMKWSNIDLEAGVVKICVNIQYSPKTGLYETTPKNGKSREIILNGYPLLLLRKLKKEQMMKVFNKGVANTVYCFEGSKGGPMNPNAISNRLHNLGMKCGVPEFHPHMLRHTMATISISNGADITAISRKLGHSNVSTTLNIYSHATRESFRRNNEILANILYADKQEVLAAE